MRKKIRNRYENPLRIFLHYLLNDIIDIADKKNKKRGAFDEKIFLEKVIESE